MKYESDLHLEMARFEDQFMELNLQADLSLQQQLEAIRDAFEYQIEKLYRVAVVTAYVSADPLMARMDSR